MSKLQKIPTVINGITETQDNQTVDVDSPQWCKWLETVQSFRYCPTTNDAPFTVRRERDYWYGYRKFSGKLHKRYIGTTDNLSSARLNEVANLLNNLQGEQANKTVTQKSGYSKKVTEWVTKDEFEELRSEIAVLRSELRGKLAAR